MSRAPAFQYYAKDHIATKASLTMEERGTWSTLVDHCWENGGPLSMAIALRLVGKTRLQSVRFLLHIEGDAVTFDWLEEVRAKQALRSDINSTNGRLGGRGNRRGRRHKSERLPNGNRTEREKKPFRAADADSIPILSIGKERAGDLPFKSVAFGVSWTHFEAMRVKKKKPLTPYTRSLILADLERMGEAKAIKALDKSTLNLWPDVYEPANGTHAHAANGTHKAKAHTGTL